HLKPFNPPHPRYVAEAGRGLEHIHGKGYVHKDVKPSNIVLFRDP
ncbi:unnamed protein product, partial [Discosporangium mesarthrocarpum]